MKKLNYRICLLIVVLFLAIALSGCKGRDNSGGSLNTGPTGTVQVDINNFDQSKFDSARFQ